MAAHRDSLDHPKFGDRGKGDGGICHAAPHTGVHPSWIYLYRRSRPQIHGQDKMIGLSCDMPEYYSLSFMIGETPTEDFPLAFLAFCAKV